MQKEKRNRMMDKKKKSKKKTKNQRKKKTGRRQQMISRDCHSSLNVARRFNCLGLIASKFLLLWIGSPFSIQWPLEIAGRKDCISCASQIAAGRAARLR
jgi:hypothetical protein